MCMCVCVCVCVCVCECVSVCESVCAYVCIHAYVCVRMCAYMHMSVCLSVCLCLSPHFQRHSISRYNNRDKLCVIYTYSRLYNRNLFVKRFIQKLWCHLLAATSTCAIAATIGRHGLLYLRKRQPFTLMEKANNRWNRYMHVPGAL